MKGSMKEKLQRISELDEIDEKGPSNLPIGLLKHAILNTIPLLELVKFFVAEDSHIQVILSNLFKRLKNEKDCLDIYEITFEILKVSNYRSRQRLRPLLEVMSRQLNEQIQFEYISYFLSSRYMYEQRSAIKLAEEVWNEDIELLLWQTYQRTQDLEILSVIVSSTDSDNALELIKKNWTKYISKKIIVKFMSRLKGRTVEDLNFLKLVDPANYIGLLRHAKGEIDRQMLRECYYATPEKRDLLPYGTLAIWDNGILSNKRQVFSLKILHMHFLVFWMTYLRNNDSVIGLVNIPSLV